MDSDVLFATCLLAYYLQNQPTNSWSRSKLYLCIYYISYTIKGAFLPPPCATSPWREGQIAPRVNTWLFCVFFSWFCFLRFLIGKCELGFIIFVHEAQSRAQGFIPRGQRYMFPSDSTTKPNHWDCSNTQPFPWRDLPVPFLWPAALACHHQHRVTRFVSYLFSNAVLLVLL